MTVPSTRRRKKKRLPLVADAGQLASLLSVCVRSIRKWDASGKIPRPINLGDRVVWVRREIRAWLEAGAPDRAAWERIKKRPK